MCNKIKYTVAKFINWPHNIYNSGSLNMIGLDDLRVLHHYELVD